MENIPTPLGYYHVIVMGRIIVIYKKPMVRTVDIGYIIFQLIAKAVMEVAGE